MNVWAKKILVYKAIILTILFMSFAAQSAQPANEKLLNTFLEENQKNALVYFQDNIDNHKSILSCLESQSSCTDSYVETEINNKAAQIKFDQSDLVEFMRARHKEYRFMVGLAFHDVIKNFVGHGRMSITPIKSAGAVIFDFRSKEGKAEWESISQLYKEEVDAISTHNNWLHSIGDLTVGNADNLNFMKHQIAIYIQKFPFLTKMMTHKSAKSEYVNAVKKMITTYERAHRNIASLEGDDRFEILGFVNIFQATLESFTQDEQQEIAGHFEYLEETNTIWKQIRDIITSKYTLGMIGCYTVAAFSTPVFAPIIGTICGSIALGFAIPGMYNLYQDTARMFNYLASGGYDEGVFNRYMMSNAISGVMYTIWLVGFVPGFSKGLVQTRVNAGNAVRKIKIRGSRLMNMSKEALLNEAKLIWSYTWYYGRELGMEVTAEQLAAFAGKSNAILPVIARSFTNTLRKVRAANPSIVRFSDILALSRQATATAF
jgi:hypothetical protein